MGLFRRKKKSNNIIAVGSTDSDSGEPTTKKTSKKSKKSKQKDKKKKTKNTNNNKASKQSKPSVTSSSSSNSDDEISSVELGDIPRSISTTTHDSNNLNNNGGYYTLPPPDPQTPNREDGRNDEDSIGSPCEAMRRLNVEKTEERRCDVNDNINNNTATTNKNNTTAERKVDNISTKKLLTKLTSSTTPSLHLLPEYTAALTEEHSPDTAGELPSRVLRALFSLSEHKESHEVRVALVRDGNNTTNTTNTNKNISNTNEQSSSNSAGKLIPTLLTFLRRCPKDSSEQYLTLLVLNNLSIPTENKRLVGLECGATNVLGNMLLEDVGCHLLVIVIVNLTFCDVGVRRSLLLGSGSDDCSSESKNESGGDGEEVQLVDCLTYALMLSSITTEQLSTLGPIPLHSPNGTPHTPHELLSILKATLSTTFPNVIHNSGDYDHVVSPPLLLLSDNENCPFPETARWCLCALKNLTRPDKKWSSFSSSGSDGTSSSSGRSIGLNNEEVLSGDAIAARAIIDAGLVPILLRVIRVAKKKKKGDTTESSLDASSASSSEEEEERSNLFIGLLPDEICNEGHVVSPNMVNMPTWNSNSAQDAALYTLMHMASIPSVSEDLLRKSGSVGGGGGSLVIDELKNIVDCGLDGVGVGDRLLDVVTGDGLVADVDRVDGAAMAVEGAELGWLALQCMKARISLSYLLNAGTTLSEKYNNYCSSHILIAEHEAHSLVELLSHCLENRSKEGPGGYSGATFTLRGVLHSIRCLLAMDAGNRSKFASINGARLNALLLKVVARHALLSDEGDNNNNSNNNSSNNAIDNEAVDDAVVCLYYMSHVGFHESACMPSHDQSAFLPSTFGRRSKKSGSNSSSSTKNCDAKDIIVKVLTLYIGKISASSSNAGRHAAIQLMLRASLLRFEGEVADLTYIGKRYPSRMDFNFDDKLLAAADSLQIEKQTEGIRPKPIIFGRRQIARYERYGSNKPKLYANPITAAEDVAFNIMSHSKVAVDDIAIANDIASSAEGLLPGGESHGFIWEWYDGVTVVVDDVQSQISRRTNTSRESKVSRRTNTSLELSARSEKKSSTIEGKEGSSTIPNQRGILGKLGNMMSVHDDEPISIFGFRCAAPRCGRNTTV